MLPMPASRMCPGIRNLICQLTPRPTASAAHRCTHSHRPRDRIRLFRPNQLVVDLCGAPEDFSKSWTQETANASPPLRRLHRRSRILRQPLHSQRGRHLTDAIGPRCLYAPDRNSSPSTCLAQLNERIPYGMLANGTLVPHSCLQPPLPSSSCQPLQTQILAMRQICRRTPFATSVPTRRCLLAALTRLWKTHMRTPTHRLSTACARTKASYGKVHLRGRPHLP